jgi:hypothetical protein
MLAAMGTTKRRRCTGCRSRSRRLEADDRCEACWRARVTSTRVPDRTAAADDPLLPAWAFPLLAVDPATLVRAHLIARTDLPAGLLAQLADPHGDTEPRLLRLAAVHPHLGDHARVLVDTDDVHTLRGVAHNRSTPADTLRSLALHPDSTVHGPARRRALAAQLDADQLARLPVGVRSLLG